ncbi:MFS transporter [Streptomyces sp. NPDC012888]|uniref:MFS transporter n=1 Tax=Streptomyces sp. NPDC012888 TaxID=3364855 RepID=UPI0036B4BCD4
MQLTERTRHTRHTRPAAPRAAGPATRQVPALWPALLAAPAAAGANAPVLILPDIAASWGAGTATAAWFVQAFAWGMAVGTPLAAGLVRLRGPRPALRTSAALVLAGTLALLASPWLPLALAGRVAQALGAAGLIAVAMGLAGSARRMGAITAGFGVLGATGPLLGSWIGGTTSWRVALAVSLVALAAVPVVDRHAAAGRPDPGARFDARGAALLLALVTALVVVPRHPLPALAAAVPLGVLLALHVRARSAGFVPVAVLRAPGFLPSALLACALSTSYFTLLFAVPHWLGERTDWSATAIGTGQLLALLLGSALSWVLAAASLRLGHRRVLAVLAGAGVLAPLTALTAPWAALLLPVAALAVFATTGGNATLSVRAAGGVGAAHRPAALGLFTLCYQLGGAFGPALAAVLLYS